MEEKIIAHNTRLKKNMNEFEPILFFNKTSKLTKVKGWRKKTCNMKSNDTNSSSEISLNKKHVVNFKHNKETVDSSLLIKQSQSEKTLNDLFKQIESTINVKSNSELLKHLVKKIDVKDDKPKMNNTNCRLGELSVENHHKTEVSMDQVLFKESEKKNSKDVVNNVKAIKGFQKSAFISESLDDFLTNEASVSSISSSTKIQDTSNLQLKNKESLQNAVSSNIVNQSFGLVNASTNCINLIKKVKDPIYNEFGIKPKTLAEKRRLLEQHDKLVKKRKIANDIKEEIKERRFNQNLNKHLRFNSNIKKKKKSLRVLRSTSIDKDVYISDDEPLSKLRDYLFNKRDNDNSDDGMGRILRSRISHDKKCNNDNVDNNKKIKKSKNNLSNDNDEDSNVKRNRILRSNFLIAKRKDKELLRKRKRLSLNNNQNNIFHFNNNSPFSKHRQLFYHKLLKLRQKNRSNVLKLKQSNKFDNIKNNNDQLHNLFIKRNLKVRHSLEYKKQQQEISDLNKSIYIMPLNKRLPYDSLSQFKDEKEISGDNDDDIKNIINNQIAMVLYLGLGRPLYQEQYDNLQLLKPNDTIINDDWAKFAVSALLDTNEPTKIKPFVVPVVNQDLIFFMHKLDRIKDMYESPVPNDTIVNNTINVLNNKDIDVNKNDNNSELIGNYSLIKNEDPLTIDDANNTKQSCIDYCYNLLKSKDLTVEIISKDNRNPSPFRNPNYNRIRCKSDKSVLRSSSNNTHHKLSSINDKVFSEVIPDITIRYNDKKKERNYRNCLRNPVSSENSSVMSDTSSLKSDNESSLNKKINYRDKHIYRTPTGKGKIRSAVQRELRRLNADYLEINDDKCNKSDDDNMSSKVSSVISDNLSPEKLDEVLPEGVVGKLAKVEKEYHQTIMKSKDDYIFLTSYGERSKRIKKLPQKLKDVMFLGDKGNKQSSKKDNRKLSYYLMKKYFSSSQQGQKSKYIYKSENRSNLDENINHLNDGFSYLNIIDTDNNHPLGRFDDYDDNSNIEKLKNDLIKSNKTTDKIEPLLNKFDLSLEIKSVSSNNSMPSEDGNVLSSSLLDILQNVKSKDNEIKTNEEQPPILNPSDILSAPILIDSNCYSNNISSNETINVQDVNFKDISEIATSGMLLSLLKPIAKNTIKCNNTSSELYNKSDLYISSNQDISMNKTHTDTNLSSVYNVFNNKQFEYCPTDDSFKKSNDSIVNTFKPGINSPIKIVKGKIPNKKLKYGIVVQTNRSVLKKNVFNQINKKFVENKELKLVPVVEKLKFPYHIPVWCMYHKIHNCVCLRRNRNVAMKKTNPTKHFLKGFMINDNDFNSNASLDIDKNNISNKEDNEMVLLPRIENVMSLNPEDFFNDSAYNNETSVLNSTDVNNLCHNELDNSVVEDGISVNQDIFISDYSSLPNESTLNNEINRNNYFKRKSGKKKTKKNNCISVSKSENISQFVNYRFYCIYLKYPFTYIKFNGGSKSGVIIPYDRLIDIVSKSMKDKKCLHRPLKKYITNKSCSLNASFGIYAVPPKCIIYFGPYGKEEYHQLQAYKVTRKIVKDEKIGKFYRQTISKLVPFVAPEFIKEFEDVQFVQGQWWNVIGGPVNEDEIFSAIKSRQLNVTKQSVSSLIVTNNDSSILSSSSHSININENQMFLPSTSLSSKTSQSNIINPVNEQNQPNQITSTVVNCDNQNNNLFSCTTKNDSSKLSNVKSDGSIVPIKLLKVNKSENDNSFYFIANNKINYIKINDNKISFIKSEDNKLSNSSSVDVVKESEKYFKQIKSNKNNVSDKNYCHSLLSSSKNNENDSIFTNTSFASVADLLNRLNINHSSVDTSTSIKSKISNISSLSDVIESSEINLNSVPSTTFSPGSFKLNVPPLLYNPKKSSVSSISTSDSSNINNAEPTCINASKSSVSSPSNLIKISENNLFIASFICTKDTIFCNSYKSDNDVIINPPKKSRKRKGSLYLNDTKNVGSSINVPPIKVKKSYFRLWRKGELKNKTKDVGSQCSLIRTSNLLRTYDNILSYCQNTSNDTVIALPCDKCSSRQFPSTNMKEEVTKKNLSNILSGSILDPVKISCISSQSDLVKTNDNSIRNTQFSTIGTNTAIASPCYKCYGKFRATSKKAKMQKIVLSNIENSINTVQTSEVPPVSILPTCNLEGFNQVCKANNTSSQSDQIKTSDHNLCSTPSSTAVCKISSTDSQSGQLKTSTSIAYSIPPSTDVCTTSTTVCKISSASSQLDQMKTSDNISCSTPSATAVYTTSATSIPCHSFKNSLIPMIVGGEGGKKHKVNVLHNPRIRLISDSIPTGSSMALDNHNLNSKKLPVIINNRGCYIIRVPSDKIKDISAQTNISQIIDLNLGDGIKSNLPLANSSSVTLSDSTIINEPQTTISQIIPVNCVVSSVSQTAVSFVSSDAVVSSISTITTVDSIVNHTVQTAISDVSVFDFNKITQISVSKENIDCVVESQERTLNATTPIDVINSLQTSTVSKTTVDDCILTNSLPTIISSPTTAESNISNAVEKTFLNKNKSHSTESNMILFSDSKITVADSGVTNDKSVMKKLVTSDITADNLIINNSKENTTDNVETSVQKITISNVNLTDNYSATNEPEKDSLKVSTTNSVNNAIVDYAVTTGVLKIPNLKTNDTDLVETHAKNSGSLSNPMFDYAVTNASQVAVMNTSPKDCILTSTPRTTISNVNSADCLASSGSSTSVTSVTKVAMSSKIQPDISKATSVKTLITNKLETLKLNTDNCTETNERQPTISNNTSTECIVTTFSNVLSTITSTDSVTTVLSTIIPSVNADGCVLSSACEKGKDFEVTKADCNVTSVLKAPILKTKDTDLIETHAKNNGSLSNPILECVETSPSLVAVKNISTADCIVTCVPKTIISGVNSADYIVSSMESTSVTSMDKVAVSSKIQPAISKASKFNTSKLEETLGLKLNTDGYSESSGPQTTISSNTSTEFIVTTLSEVLSSVTTSDSVTTILPTTISSVNIGGCVMSSACENGTDFEVAKADITVTSVFKAPILKTNNTDLIESHTKNRGSLSTDIVDGVTSPSMDKELISNTTCPVTVKNITTPNFIATSMPTTIISGAAEVALTSESQTDISEATTVKTLITNELEETPILKLNTNDYIETNVPHATVSNNTSTECTTKTTLSEALSSLTTTDSMRTTRLQTIPSVSDGEHIETNFNEKPPVFKVVSIDFIVNDKPVMPVLKENVNDKIKISIQNTELLNNTRIDDGIVTTTSLDTDDCVKNALPDAMSNISTVDEISVSNIPCLSLSKVSSDSNKTIPLKIPVIKLHKVELIKNSSPTKIASSITDGNLDVNKTPNIAISEATVTNDCIAMNSVSEDISNVSASNCMVTSLLPIAIAKENTDECIINNSHITTAKITATDCIVTSDSLVPILKANVSDEFVTKEIQETYLSSNTSKQTISPADNCVNVSSENLCDSLLITKPCSSVSSITSPTNVVTSIPVTNVSNIIVNDSDLSNSSKIISTICKPKISLLNTSSTGLPTRKFCKCIFSEFPKGADFKKLKLLISKKSASKCDCTCKKTHETNASNSLKTKSSDSLSKTTKTCENVCTETITNVVCDSDVNSNETLQTNSSANDNSNQLQDDLFPLDNSFLSSKTNVNSDKIHRITMDNNMLQNKSVTVSFDNKLSNHSCSSSNDSNNKVNNETSSSELLKSDSDKLNVLTFSNNDVLNSDLTNASTTSFTVNDTQSTSTLTNVTENSSSKNLLEVDSLFVKMLASNISEMLTGSANNSTLSSASNSTIKSLVDNKSNDITAAKNTSIMTDSSVSSCNIIAKLKDHNFLSRVLLIDSLMSKISATVATELLKNASSSDGNDKLNCDSMETSNISSSNKSNDNLNEDNTKIFNDELNNLLLPSTSEILTTDDNKSLINENITSPLESVPSVLSNKSDIDEPKSNDIMNINDITIRKKYTSRLDSNCDLEPDLLQTYGIHFIDD